MYLNYIAGGGGNLPKKPFTRLELFLDYIARNLTGGGSSHDSGGGQGSRVQSLDSTNLVSGGIIEAVGKPVYVSDVTLFSEYNLTETGWYIFARIAAKDATITAQSVEGAAYVPGAGYVNIAVRFEVAAVSKTVVVNWGAETETFIFRASDLAIQNLDYRVTFYVYDIADFATWQFTPATDANFTDGKYYYVKDANDNYIPADVTSYTIGDPIPANAYYVHSKAIFEGMVQNITYVCNTVIDCPVEFILPSINDEIHGTWYEIRFRHAGSYSSVLTPPSPDVKVATEHTQAETAGMNMVDLHYTAVAGQKVWRFMNTHSSFTPAAPALESIVFRTPPTKTTYTAGEALDTTGAVVVATYADGHTKIVTATFTPANGAALTAENTVLTASYTEGGVTATTTTALTVE